MNMDASIRNIGSKGFILDPQSYRENKFRTNSTNINCYRFISFIDIILDFGKILFIKIEWGKIRR